ncbi:hypothetical protein UNDKW_3381 [Undibacterium sp. KW1]|nr:hypothetical protein UNDKW_3381 [Undibacterium sp. KW1]
MLLLPTAILLIALFGVPMFWVIFSSLNIDVHLNQNWDLSLLLNVLTDRTKRTGLIMSLYYSVVPVLLALPLSIGIAMQLQRDFFGRDWFLILFKIPVAMPGIVLAFVMLALFDQGGLVSRFVNVDTPRIIRDYLGLGAILALAIKELPFMSLLIGATLSSISPLLLNASRSLGANQWMTFWHVQLPLAWPGISAAMVLSFIKLLGAYAIPQIIGPIFPAPLSVMMVDAFREGSWNEVCAIGVVLSLCSVLILYFYDVFIHQYNQDRVQ